MLSRISHVRSYRGLAENPFDEIDQRCSLGNKTVIYGSNGAGKSTLSELLRTTAARGAVSMTMVTVVDGQEHQEAVHENKPWSFSDRLHVFNRWYVESILKMFLDGTGSVDGIVKLGENKDRQDLVERHEKELADLKIKESRAQDARDAEKKQWDRIIERVKGDVIEVLKTVDPATYNTQAFNISRARRDLEAGGGDALTHQEIQDLVSEAQALSDGSLRAPLAFSFSLDQLRVLVETALSATVQSATLDKLRDHRTAAWTQEGLDLHGDSTKCLFCEGDLAPSMVDAYERHFDSGSRTLRSEIESALSQFAITVRPIDALEKEIGDSMSVVPSLRVRFAEHAERLREELASQRSYLHEAETRLRRRLQTTLDEPSDAPEPPDTIDLTSLNDVLEEHNSVVVDRDQRRGELVSAVRRAISLRSRDDFLQRTSGLAKNDSLLEEIATQIVEVTGQRNREMAAQKDTSLMAELLDRDVTSYFGRQDLRITVSEDARGYEVRRGGARASHLSEGERTAIALLFFLRTLEAEGIDTGSLVVVVDDPMTSLDRSALYSAHALLEERLEQFAQSIVLTHDHEYLRLCIQSLKKWQKSRPDDSAKAMIPARAILEMRAVETADGGRESTLRSLPAHLGDHSSEYHYLFWRVTEAILTDESRELPLIGNAARRLLEGFLSFQAPHHTNFQAKIDYAANKCFCSDATKQRVLRFVHGQSHRDTGDPLSNLGIPNTLQEIVIVCRFIELCDPHHFANMLETANAADTWWARFPKKMVDLRSTKPSTSSRRSVRRERKRAQRVHGDGRGGGDVE